jgi:fumarylacetoacetase
MTTMQRPVDDTHDPRLRSWVASANAVDSDFPIQNLPFGVFRRRGSNERPRIGVAIGDEILDVPRCLQSKLRERLPPALCDVLELPALNGLMAMGPPAMSALRRWLIWILGADGPAAGPEVVVPMHEAELHLPVSIREYTDFYASIYHATNVGRLFRPDNPLLPNYKYVPIAYHGRSSSIVVAGTPIRRPSGQIKRPDAAAPSVQLSARLDYEVEVGAFVGPGNPLGEPVSIDDAEHHLFGVCLLNDWSARDLQAWEYQPLGPFLAKNFATTISPWIVTMEALAPFRLPAFVRPAGDPKPLPYLDSAANQQAGGVDIVVDAFLRSRQMRERRCDPLHLSTNRLRDMYWTPAQMLTHHASNGCNLRTGDLLGSGTVSGPTDDEVGSLLELTRQGSRPLTLPTGESRTFLEDGDEVIFHGYCAREGRVRIGLGECSGVLVGAPGTPA